MSKDNLENLLNALTETSVYVVDASSHRLLYFNQRCRDASRGKAVLGAEFCEVWPEFYDNCSLDTTADKACSHTVCYDAGQKAPVDVTTNSILWDGNIPAVVVTATPHCMNLEEDQGLLKIKRMYMQSLLTVFDECIIANLTKDYYVSCQKDIMWTDIPERGQFALENRNYASKTVHPDDLELFDDNFSRDAMLRKFGAGEKAVSKRLRRLVDDSTYHLVEFTAAKIELPREDECWCVLVFRDIQDEYLRERQRSLEISQLATAARAAYQMLIAVNLTQNTYRMMEYVRDSVRHPGGEGCFDELIEAEAATVHPDYREEFRRKFLRQALTDAYTGGERIVAMEVPHLGKDGRCHWYFTQVVRVENPSTDDLLEITLSRNIDEEHRLQQETLEKERRAKQLLEEALREAERASRAKSDFLSRMSHDIRTPMNAIIGMTEIALAHLEDEDKVGECLRKVSLSSKHLLGLINDILDMSKIESDKMTMSRDAVYLPEILENVVAIIQPAVKEKQQRFIVRLHEVRHEFLRSDALRLRQILINILSNAVKFTPAGGDITMTITERGPDRPGTARFRFEFSDTGIGMNPEFLEHLFDAFTRERDSRVDRTEGSGLGMAITKRIVDMLGGTIAVRSRQGAGSTFIVDLPLEITAEPQPAPPEVQGLSLLVVDEDSEMKEYVLQMISGAGMRGEFYSDGGDALRRMEELQRRGAGFDAAFLDWQVPRHGGLHLAQKIRERMGDGFPIILVSSYDWSDRMEEAQKISIAGFLTKPVFPSTLLQCVQRYALHREPTPMEPELGFDFKGKRFLLTEDNELNREIAVELLTATGVSIDCAVNGAESVKRFRASPEHYYDLILMDIQMPVMDGYAAARAIRALPRKDALTVPILAMTADVFMEDVAAAKAAGMNGHLAKPIDILAVKREITRALNEKP